MTEISNNYKYPKNGELWRTVEFFNQCAAWKTSEQKRYRRESCPTENIRYQYGDPRQVSSRQVNGVLFERIVRLIHMDPNRIIDPDKLRKTILSASDPIAQEIGNRVINAFETFDGFTEGIIPNAEIYTDQMYELIMNISPQYSRIRKQLEKMPKDFRPEWIKIIIYNSILSAGDTWISSPWILNVYTILRLFKVQKDGPSPALSVMYFGNAHTMIIMQFLTKNFGYKMIYSDELVEEHKPENDKRNLTARCLIFNKHININKLLINGQEQRQRIALRQEKRGRKSVKGGRRHTRKNCHTRKK